MRSAGGSQLHVQCESLTPAQIATPLRLLRHADCYLQRGVKFPQCGIFHSYAELLNFALCEGDSEVQILVPQPFRLTVSGRRYVPDLFMIRGGERVVCELKPRGELRRELHEPLEAFFTFHGYHFEVVSNESVLEKECSALNWLHALRILSSSADLGTDYEETALWEEVCREEWICFSDLIELGDRRQSCTREIALFRLLHRGLLAADWSRERLSPSTRIRLCS